MIELQEKKQRVQALLDSLPKGGARWNGSRNGSAG